jgi:hypothetical protein
MTHPEQFAAAAPERELHTPVLYEHTLVLDALTGEGLIHDDIDYLAGVVISFNEMIPSWSTVEELGKMVKDLEQGSAAIQLVQEAAQIVADEYWTQVYEVDQEAAAILSRVPGLIYAHDLRSGAVFQVESFLLGTDRSHAAQMFAHGDGVTQLCRRQYLETYVDANRLQPSQRALLEDMAEEHEITPFRP